MSEMVDEAREAQRVSSIEELERHYGEANPKSLVKEIDYISDSYRRLIEASPFVVMATCAEEGLDCSPRGDPPGFVRVQDDKTVLMPDRNGNNRIDSLRNIVRDPRISLLFLIPGIGETLRINGRACIRVDRALLESFAIRGKVPRSVIEVTVDRIYFQCQKALVRSALWKADAQVPKSSVPSAGDILQELSKTPFDGKQYDRDYPQRLKKTIY